MPEGCWDLGIGLKSIVLNDAAIAESKTTVWDGHKEYLIGTVRGRNQATDEQMRSRQKYLALKKMFAYDCAGDDPWAWRRLIRRP